MPDALTIPAHAKVNLCLGVGPPQPAEAAGTPNPHAGWHPICSWMAPIDLADELTLHRLTPHNAPREGLLDAEPACELTITWAADAPRPSPIDWPIERDLAFRAHAALQAHVARPLPVRASLRKRIPTGGGLGGGSADAAAMLVGLNALFDLGLSTQQLAPLALSLGSDVGFFLRDQPLAQPCPQLVESFGERRSPLAHVGAALALFFPPFACETRAVYKAFDRAPTAGTSRERVLAAHARALERGRIDPSLLFNDLCPPAQVVRPELGPLMASLTQRTGLGVHLSGSGSTLFALADSPADQGRALTEAHALGLAALGARLR
jgi:4-diphosphocytidyl-2-C-methyl-D-erythritol kinase